MEECEPEKSHMFFSLILDPRYIQLNALLQLHKLEKHDAGNYFKYMMDLLLEYIVAAEEKQNPTLKLRTRDLRSQYSVPDALSFGVDGLDDTTVLQSLKSRAKREFEIYKQLVK